MCRAAIDVAEELGDAGAILGRAAIADEQCLCAEGVGRFARNQPLGRFGKRIRVLVDRQHRTGSFDRLHSGGGNLAFIV